MPVPASRAIIRGLRVTVWDVLDGGLPSRLCLRFTGWPGATVPLRLLFDAKLSPIVSADSDFLGLANERGAPQKNAPSERP